MTQSKSASPNEPIAIIGSGCRFPGQSSSPSKLWQLLLKPRDLRKEIPVDRFNSKAFYHPDHNHHGTSNVLHSYLLDEDHRAFDAQFFSIKPAEAHCMDPQHRILLETVYESIESAGLRMEDLKGSDTAVYVGLMYADYGDMLLRDPESFPTYVSTGTTRSILSNRVSYFFDWHGPSMTIDTACSSSLVAVHEAVQLLRSGRSRVAVAAGANLCILPEPYIAESKLQMLSPTGQSRMWDSKANGYARGEGIAAVVLKTLRDALADGDHIECLVRETGINQDGRTKGITMPSALAQTALIRDTYTRAGLDLQRPEDRPQYFEAHGTGTPTGDPLEAEAIHKAFSQAGCDGHLYVGSIKTVIGHTEGTAGVAGLLKASMALQNAIVPANMLFDELNPNIAPFYTNLEIATSAQPWPNLAPGVPRRASVNSFGFGGTNAHAIVEAYTPEPESQVESDVAFVPFLFSAASDKSLERSLAAYATYLEEHESVSMRDLAWSLHSRRSRFPTVAAVSGTTRERLLESLRAKLDPSEAAKSASQPQQISRVKEPKILGVFTGQGAQWATMGRELWQHSPKVREIIKSLDDALQSLPSGDRPDWTLSAELMADAADSRIASAEVSQPMCTAVQLVLLQLLHAAGVSLHAVVGHSSGEIAAAHAAGFLSATDAIRIAYYRGMCSRYAQGPNGEKGAMLAVGTSLADAEELCGEPEFEGRITVAAVNSATSVTLSGDADVIVLAKEVLDEENKFARLLVVDKAYHSHHMVSASDRYLALLQNVQMSIHQPSDTAPRWYSSVTGNEVTWDQAENLAAAYWNDNLVNRVRYTDAVECAVESNGPFDITVELGPHPALRGPTLQNLQDLGQPSPVYTPTLRRGANGVEAMADCLGALWQTLPIASLDLAQYDTFVRDDDTKPKLLKDLPSYAWDHDQVYWYEPRVWKATRSRKMPSHPLLGVQCPDGVEQEFRWRNFLTPRELPWLLDHRIQGQIVFPGAGYVCAAVEAAKAMSSSDAVSIRLVELLDIAIPQALVFTNESASVETLVSITNIVHEHKGSNNMLTANFAFYSAVGRESTVMTRNAAGRLRVTYGEPSVHALPKQRPSLAGDMVDVPSERFYNSLESLGYGYTGPFRALTNLRRKHGVTTGSILQQPSQETESLTIRPATLDAAIQTVLLARSFPGDGELWRLQVPRGVRRIVVNPMLCEVADASVETAFPADCVLAQADGVETEGDIDIYSPDGQYTMARIEGMQAVPVEAATAETDRPFFSGVVWRHVSPDDEAAPFLGRATADNYELAYVMERVAAFYLKQLHLSFPDDDAARHKGPYIGLLNFASHITKTVAAGEHRYARPEWVEDSQDLIMRESQRFPENVDLALMHIIAEHIVDAVRGDSHILEHLTKNNMLARYYEEAMGMRYYIEHLGRVVGLLGHRYPHMKILEIGEICLVLTLAQMMETDLTPGAGTGAATKQALNNLGGSFSSYTFTDISSGFFDNARELFGLQDKMRFQVLDIEKDLISQEFPEHSYDLVIASFVLHATSTLKSSLNNVRRLLKPGGYLILLEVSNPDVARLGYIFGSLPGWWLGAEDGRVLSPCVTNAEWDRLLRETGFSGIDTVTSDVDSLPFPASTIVSQALDSTVEFLRDPPRAGSTPRLLDNATVEIAVLGGVSERMKAVREEILHQLTLRFGSVSAVDSLEDLQSNPELIPSGALTLNLSDLDAPIFKDLTTASLAGIKLLYEQSRYVLWVTEDSRGGNAYHHQSLGLGRSMAVEIRHVQSQFLDLDVVTTKSASTIISALLRFLLVNVSESSDRAQELLWSTEPELAIVQGKEMIPRVKLNHDANTRYNATRRPISEPINIRAGNGVIEVARTSSGRYSVVQSSIPSPASTLAVAGKKRIRVDTSSLNPIPLTGNDSLYLFAGIILSTREKVMGFATTSASIVDVPDTWIMPVEGDVGPSLSDALSHILIRSILTLVSDGGVLIVIGEHQPLTEMLQRHASIRGIRVIFIASGEAPGIKPMMPSAQVTFHPQAHIRTIRNALPSIPVSVLDMGLDSGEGGILWGQLRSALHPDSTFEKLSAILDRPVRYTSSDVAAQVIRAMSSLQRCQASATPADSQIKDLTIQEVPGLPADSQSPLQLIDWTRPETVTALARSVGEYPLIKSDKTYWLVGLTGSLGLSLCRWLVQHGARNIVLTSRNPNIDGEALMEIVGCSGARVEIYPGDVTDPTSLRAVYDRINSTLPSIAGVAQGAMVLDDTLIKDMDISSMERVMRPKVTGSIHLDALFSPSPTHAPLPLDFFIFFSSATCITGNIGQSNYAAANMFMASMAANRRRRGLAGSVIHIGAIMGVGYVTRETTEALQRNLQKSGHVWMSEGDFHAVFAEGILAGYPETHADFGGGHGWENGEIICGLRLTETTDEQRPLWTYNPQFHHLVQSASNTSSSDEDSALNKHISLKSQLQDVRTSEQLFDIVKNSFLRKLRILLGISPSETSASEQQNVVERVAEELGIDSLNIVEIRSWFLKELKADIPVLRILGGATIGDIIRFALEKVPSELVPNLVSEVVEDSVVQQGKAATVTVAA
ncbi:uncharacterized protein DSM5745_10441 [Aspergillus mulundensis]|uniref:Uncharacterized protein n=1 Tax=Aspergillus mulundensis TaxID=1810919 RepID=A0A3D8QJ14_9EURO|nr:hypothetical protein DSM5745_10441 [Aspergillus mulundensis]RDW61769.1 hypothetical protein DSM5745_10441 [Aspergillus mulundensis]